MADTGTPWGLPYPLLTDAPNGPQSVQDLAEGTAGALGYAYPCTSATRPTNKAGLIIHETDTGLLLYGDGTEWQQLMIGDDTGWVDLATEGFVAQSGYTLQGGYARRRSGVVSIYATMTTSAGFAGGNITNTAVLQAPGGWYPTESPVGGLSSGGDGGVLTVYLQTTGLFYVTASATAYSAAATFQVAGTYHI